MYDFNKIIDRKGTSSWKYDFYEEYNKPSDTLSMWIADMDFPTVPEVVKKMEDVAIFGIYGYARPMSGYYEALKNWYKTHFDADFENEQVVFTPGIVFALNMAVKTYTNEGDGVLVMRPVYYPFLNAIKNNKRKLINSPLVYSDGKYSINFTDLEKKIVDEKVKLMLLCNPHNPTMDVWEKKDLERVARLAAKYHVLVVVDEIYAEHVWEEGLMVPYGALSDAEHNCIVCTSLGKSFNFTGTSHANIIIPDDTIRGAYITQRNSDHYGSLSPFMRAALLGGYTKEGKEWIDALMEFSGENEKIVRDFFAENFPKVHFCRHRAGTLLWADFREMGTEEEVYAWFQKAGVEPDLGSKYGEEGRGFLRLQIGMPKRELNYALERIKKAYVK